MFWVTMTSWSPPIASAAASAPSFDDWLNDLSSSCPTSVTTPTLSASNDAAGDSLAAGEPGASDSSAGLDGAAAEAEGLGEPPPPQAATRMARPLNSVRPRERLRMCPPPTSRTRSRRPALLHVRSGRGLEERSPHGATIGAHRTDGRAAGQEPSMVRDRRSARGAREG